MSSTLAAIFLARLQLPEALDAARPADLEERIDQMVAGAVARWPGLKADPRVFVGYLGDHLAAQLGASGDLAAALAGCHVDDLYLAFACVEDLAGAHAAFDREFLGSVGRYVARFRRGEAFSEEIRQLVRERLLLAPAGGVPRISAYSGRGPLMAWVRVAIMRVAIDRLRQLAGEPDDHKNHDDLFDLAQPDSATNPELTIIKDRHGPGLQQAFNAALAGLTAKERTLLRMHYVDGVTLDRMATAYRVHRATVARWLQTAREDLFARTREHAVATMAIPASELSSVWRLLVSKLDVSLRTYFGSQG